MQQQLNKLYESIYKFDEQLGAIPGLSPPLLISIPSSWGKAVVRILIVGQESYGWGICKDTHGIPGGRCEHCPYPCFKYYVHWLALQNRVDALLHAYDTFAFAENQTSSSRSPFGRAFREIKSEASQLLISETISMLWTNLFKMDVFGTSAREAGSLDLICRAQSELLRKEIKILKPNAVICFTGPTLLYENELRNQFKNIEYESIEGTDKREIAKLVHGSLPQPSFRTYHPNYLQQSGRWSCVARVADLVVQEIAASG